MQDLKEYSTLKERYQVLQRHHDDLQEMTKRGEVLLTSQVKELQIEHEKMQVKLMNEIIQRKRLHNVLDDMKGKIRVYCRVRPLNATEKARNAQ